MTQNKTGWALWKKALYVTAFLVAAALLVNLPSITNAIANLGEDPEAVVEEQVIEQEAADEEELLIEDADEDVVVIDEEASEDAEATEGEEPELGTAAAETGYVKYWISYGGSAGTEVYAEETFAAGETVHILDTPSIPGYKIGSWYTSSASNTVATDFVMEAGGKHHLRAYATVGEYTITYMLNGEQVGPVHSYKYGETVTFPALPQREGMTVTGWDTSSLTATGNGTYTMPGEDIIINAIARANSYTITYMVDGEEYSTEMYAYGASIEPLAAPTKTGYTFSGWDIDVPSTMPAENLTISGEFVADTHTITYMVDGEEYATETYAYGEDISALAAPTKEGYSFSGWNKELPSTMPAQDLVLSGDFSINSYALVYKVDGEDYAAAVYEYGAELSPIAAPSKEGYTFSGWDTELPATMPAGDLVISGEFAINEYTITYVINGEVYAYQTYEYDEPTIAPEDLSKEGYTFSGWDIEVPATMPAADLTVSGELTINEYTITYMINDRVYATVAYQYGAPVTTLADPALTGTTFYGWDTPAPAYMPAENLVITAKTSANYYTITYMVNGEKYATSNYAYGASVTPIADPAKEGYTFSGWDTLVPETMPERDVVISGELIPGMFQVTWLDASGNVLQSDSVEYGTVPTYTGATPTRSANYVYTYEFAGWDKELAPVTSNVTYKPVFESIFVDYTVRFVDYDGTLLYAKTDCHYGDPLEAPADPTRSGYTFTGWSPIITVITGSATITAAYEANVAPVPAEPETPETPDVPAENETPNTPAENETPSTPTEDETPNTPAENETPNAPAENGNPDLPSTPNTPIYPEGPTVNDVVTSEDPVSSVVDATAGYMAANATQATAGTTAAANAGDAAEAEEAIEDDATPEAAEEVTIDDDATPQAAYDTTKEPADEFPFVPVAAGVGVVVIAGAAIAIAASRRRSSSK